MDKELIFNVGIKGLESKICRRVGIKSSDTLADLVYFILTSFELYSNKFFTISYDSDKYDSANVIFDNNQYKSAMGIMLKDIDFDVNKELILEYNYQNKIEFVINFIDSINISLDDDYPKIIDGAGKGAIDYVSGCELKQIVDETDVLGHSNYSTTIIIDDEEEEEFFDYRDFDLNDNNFMSKINVNSVKDEYEEINLIDIIRIIKDRMVIYYKTDINSIVKPFDYIKKYIPDNYDELSDEEIKELNIPDYKDLNIYMLPYYDDLNHKDIMTLYVKRNIYDKEIRQALFYALRNYDYMDKFYDNLRRYGLFKDYLEYSNYYYEQIIKDWKIKNNIDKN